MQLSYLQERKSEVGKPIAEILDKKWTGKDLTC